MENTNAGVGMSGALSDPKDVGTALLKQGRFEEASAVLREAVALDNDDEVAWRLLGGALASKGDAEGAISAFQNAVRIVPMAARSHYNLGLAFQTAGRLPEARASLEKALSLDPGHEAARIRLGEVSQQLGQTRNVAPTASASEEGHTNIGGGNSIGLSTISSPTFQAQSQQQGQSSGGHSNIGGGDATGLQSIGAQREMPTPGAVSGHSNIGGGNATGLSSVGMATSLPQDSGHTNIGGGNHTMLGGVGNAASAQGLRPSPPSPSATMPSPAFPPPIAPPVSVGPTAYAGSPGYAPSPVLGQNYSQDIGNTSGMKGDVPYDVAKPFNWGAFLLTWSDLGFLWAFNMRLPLYGGILLVIMILGWGIGGASLAALAANAGHPGSLNNNMPMGSFSWIFGLARIGLAIYLGIKGNALAWQNRTFQSSEDFHRCQRTWAAWGIGIWVGGFILGILFFVLFFAVVLAAVSSGKFGGHLPTH
jgi:hypothetical protein